MIGILIETIIWVQNTISQTQKTMEDSLTSSLSVANQNFAASMKDIERICALAGSNVGEATSVHNYLHVMNPDSGSSDLEKLQAGREVNDFLLGLCRFQFYLTGALINDLHGHQQTFGNIMDNSDLEEQEWLEDFLESMDDARWLSPHESLSGRNADSKMVFSLVRKIKSGSEVHGIILADINYDMLRDYYNLSDMQDYLVFITSGDEENQLLYPRDQTSFSQNMKKIEIRLEVPVAGWIVHGWIPEKSIISGSMNVLRRILLVSAALNILLCIVIGVVVSYMTKELSILADAVKQVSGEHLELDVKVKSEDEVGELYRQINRMLTRIRELIIEIHDSENAKRELEILALQEQINPHFLYNTLNTITYLAQLRGVTNIQFVSSALSDMLHLALGPEKYITVEREMEYLHQYLAIMEYKYSGKFISEFDVEEETYTYMVPKMILQPLVENALKHGIATLSRPGYLHVAATLREGRLLLSVRDNGNGISEELLAKINQIPAEQEARMETSIGVYNVRNRIYLLYGSQGRFQMLSKMDEYTLAEIEIPIRNAGEE